MNKTVFITGANGGIGRALVEEFSKAGYDIIAHARNLEFQEFLDNISTKYGNTITTAIFDMRDSETMKQSVNQIIKSRIPITTLVNNAAIGHRKLFSMTSISQIREVFEINFFAQLELTQLFLRYISKQENSSIINISSIDGLDLFAGTCAYGSSKAALIAFTKSLASEYRFHNTRINTIAPGITEAKMAGFLKENIAEKVLEKSAMKRKAKADEIAKIAVFLASEDASFMNGQVIRSDGGGIFNANFS